MFLGNIRNWLKNRYRNDKFRDTVQVYFVAFVWVGLFVLMFAYDREKSQFRRLHSTPPTAPTSPVLVKDAGGAPIPVKNVDEQGEKR